MKQITLECENKKVKVSVPDITTPSFVWKTKVDGTVYAELPDMTVWIHSDPYKEGKGDYRICYGNPHEFGNWCSAFDGVYNIEDAKKFAEDYRKQAVQKQMDSAISELKNILKWYVK